MVGKQESSHKNNECSPVYNEDFIFGIPTLDDYLIKLNVMDDDVGSDKKLGEATIKLEKEGLQPGVPKEIVVTVDDKWFSKDAKATLVLTWNP